MGKDRRFVARHVGEIDVLESNLAQRRYRHGDRIGADRKVRACIEQLDQPLGSPRDLLQRAEQIAHIGERAGRDHRIDGELDDLSHADHTGKHRLAAQPDQNDQRRHGDKHHDTDEQRAGQEPFEFGPVCGFGVALEQLLLVFLLHEGFDSFDRGQRFGDHGRKIGQRILGHPRNVLHAPPHGDEREDDYWDHDDDAQRELEIGQKHHEQRADHQDQRAQGQRSGRAYRAADHRDVCIEPRCQLTNPVHVEECGVESEQVIEDVLTQIGNDPLPDHRNQIKPRAGRNRHHRTDDNEQPSIRRDGLEIFRDEPFVDETSGEIRNRKRSNRRDQKKGKRQHQSRGVAHKVRHKPAQGLERRGARTGFQARHLAFGVGGGGVGGGFRHIGLFLFGPR